MRTSLPSLRIASTFALALSLGACSASSPGGGSGTAGSGSGTGGTGTTAGMDGTGTTSGTAGTGTTAGTAGTGTTSGTAGTGTTAGTAGSGSGMAGAGTAGSGGGTAGAGTAGSGGGTAGAGAAGTAGSTAGTTGTAGMTPGCTMAPPAADKATAWTKHDIDLPAGSVDAAFISAYPPNAGSQYSWTHRNYYVKLPMGYDPTKAYPVAIGGSGCGGSETVGSEGGYSVLGVGGTQTQAIQISQSYISSSKVNACSGFADDFTNSPEPAYIHAMIQDIEAHYCVDKSKIFLNGYSSGAWQATLSGCTNSDELRAYGVQIGGGLRMKRPPCKNHPIAAMYVVGKDDTSNPIGPNAAPIDDSLGSAPSRDDILMRNGCQGNATAQWDPTYPECVKYTGCPEKYPVIWCPLTGVGHNPGPTDGTVDPYRYTAMWKFYMTLPSP